VVYITKELRINNEIRAREVRVIDNSGGQLGIMSVREAVALAEERELDLVEVSPNTDPPVCRLMDYGKFKYEQSKKDREARHKRKTLEVKEVKMRPKIDSHDYQIKAKLARRLLEEGDKVKVTMMFRGREVVYTNLAEKLMDRIAEDCGDLCVVERKAKLEGRNMIMILAPKPDHGGSAQAPAAQEDRQKSEAPKQVSQPGS
jgi:translation initiation factor IF-3